MRMKELHLVVSSLGTDTEGETLHYEVQAGTQLIVGDIEGHLPGAEYRRLIGVVPDTVEAVLITPDARLRLVPMPQEA